MKKLLAIALVSLLLMPVLSVPAYAGGGGCCWGGFAVGVGLGVLATAPFWYRPVYAYPAYAYPAYAYPAYGYPAYGYPAYSYPVYSYPTYPAPTYAPPAGSGASQSTSVTYGTPSSKSPSVQGSTPSTPTGSQNCETVTVEGHNETRTLQSGQSVTAWVPTHTQQVCR
jgi:hypothetical protein